MVHFLHQPIHVELAIHSFDILCHKLFRLGPYVFVLEIFGQENPQDVLTERRKVRKDLDHEPNGRQILLLGSYLRIQPYH